MQRKMQDVLDPPSSVIHYPFIKQSFPTLSLPADLALHHHYRRFTFMWERSSNKA